MLKAFVEKIASMAGPKTFEIEGKTFASQPLEEIKPVKDMPIPITVNGLDSVCKLVRHEAEKVGRKLFIQCQSYRDVKVFSTYDDEYDRFTLYTCTADTPAVTMGRYLSYENAVIEIRSLYIPNKDTEYLLKLLSSISKESKVTSSDNGVTQKVEARSGIALNEMVQIKPRVTLKPFRTFIEVEQPESEFLLRINDDGCIGLFQADGGVWKLEATRNVAAYFENELKDLIEAGAVVVIR